MKKFYTFFNSLTNQKTRNKCSLDKSEAILLGFSRKFVSCETENQFSL